MLTWWQGNQSAGVGVGQDIIMNNAYQVVKTVSAGNGLSADLHEFQLTPRGTALITAEYPVIVNAASVGGSTEEVVFDAVAQEVDLATGLVVFQWDSLDHVPLSAGYTLPENLPEEGQAGAAQRHVGPVRLLPHELDRFDQNGNLVTSARNTWAVYAVNHQTGAIVWTLGGKHSSFKLGPSVAFAFQHDVRVRAPGVLTMFDDGAGRRTCTRSRARSSCASTSAT